MGAIDEIVINILDTHQAVTIYTRVNNYTLGARTMEVTATLNRLVSRVFVEGPVCSATQSEYAGEPSVYVVIPTVSILPLTREARKNISHLLVEIKGAAFPSRVSRSSNTCPELHFVVRHNMHPSTLRPVDIQCGLS